MIGKKSGKLKFERKAFVSGTMLIHDGEIPVVDRFLLTKKIVQKNSEGKELQDAHGLPIMEEVPDLDEKGKRKNKGYI